MKRALLLLLLAACGGQTGTIDLELTEAPGSQLIEGLAHLRITITQPHTVVEADRGANGFNIALSVDATGDTGSLIVDGFDGGGTLVATGASPPFPIAAINAKIVVYMAAPLSIGAAPTKLPAARTGLAAAPLTYGMIVTGGTDAANAPTDGVFIYNAYDHTLLAGLALPEPRAQQAVAVGANNVAVMFGGLGPDGNPTGTFWRFDTNVAPSGAYQQVSDQPELARAGALAVTIGTDHELVTGAPAVDVVAAAATARTDAPTLAPVAATTTDPSTQRPIVVFAGDPIVRLANNTFDTIAQTIEPTAGAGGLPGGRIVFASPGTPPTRDLVVVDAVTGEVARMTDALSVVRQHAAIAATARHLVVAGGFDATGAPVATADIFDATSLALLATVPCVARGGAQAFAFLNDQIAIVGGTPANDAIELFTPPSSE